MSLITLTTDLGNGSAEIAAAKALIHKHLPSCKVIDISHTIRPYSYLEAAHVLSNSAFKFPEKTVHIVCVEGDFSRRPNWMLSVVNKHYFLSKNTGLISLIGNGQLNDEFFLEHEVQDLKAPLLKILLPNAIKLLKSGFDVSAYEIGNSVQKVNLEPQINQTGIRGTVIYINHHKNVVTNIRRKHFKLFPSLNACKIHYTRAAYFTKIHNSYYDVPEGEAACFINADGYLEIGIHGGDAENLLTMPLGKTVWIEIE